MARPERLFTREFIALNGIIFLTFCNVAVFFQLHHYLATDLHIEQEWIGLLIGLFSFTGLIIRPIISPMLHPDNSGRWISFGTTGVIIFLLLYYPARGVLSMALVRILHGGAYVVLGTAVMARLVGCIPQSRSGQAFGMVSVITLLPFAVMPPLLDPLTEFLGGYIPVLCLTALFMLPVFVLLRLIEPVIKVREEIKEKKITAREFILNLKDVSVISLLIISLLLYSAFSIAFYFITLFAHSFNIANPGWFFTISTFTEILVRLLAGHLFDRGSKPILLAVSFTILFIAYLVLANTTGTVLFYSLGLIFGLGWGVAMPLLNGILFDISPPKYRALNANLGLEMFQGGLFLGPIAGGMILGGFSYRVLYYFCGVLILICLCITPFLRREKKNNEMLEMN